MNAPLKLLPGMSVQWLPHVFHGEVLGRWLDADGVMPTIAEIVRDTPDLSRWFAEYGEVRINGHLIPRHLWHVVRPRHVPGFETVVSLIMPLHGGGGSSSSSSGGAAKKNPIALIATIAVLLVAAAVTGGAAGGLIGGLFAAGSISAAVLGAGVGIAGSLLISALVPPPKLSTPQIASDASASAAVGTPASSPAASAASLSGNALSPGAALPRVVGTMQLFPPLACNPLVEVVGDLEYAEAVFILCGPHALSGAQVGGTDISSIAEVDQQLVEGKPGDAVQTLVTRHSFTQDVNAQFSEHLLNTTTQYQLQDQINPAACVPQPAPVVSKRSPDEIWINCQWGSGLFSQSDPTIVVNQAFRVQIRVRGATSWIFLPEVHFSMNAAVAFQKVIRVKFGSMPIAALVNTPPTNAGAVMAFKTVPGQNGSTVTPATAGWTADASFSAGAGNDVLSASAFATSNVKNVELYADKVIFYLDPTVFPLGTYELQITAGSPYKSASFNPSNYQYSAQVLDFFNYYSSGGAFRIPEDPSTLSHGVTLSRLSSVKNQNPIQAAGDATMSVRVHSRALDQYSIIASGYVHDYDGIGWNTLTTSSNPATNFREVLAGNLGPNPQPASIIRDSELIDWRTRCIASNFTVNAVIEGKTYSDVLNMIASAGYGRWRHNETHGVFMDRDRSADAPVQVFTPINSRKFQWARAYPKIPTGIRANFIDADDNYNLGGEKIVYLNPDVQDASGLNQTTYDGLVHLTDVIQRANFDLDNLQKRMTFYSLETDAENIACEKGDLIEVQHDTLTRQAGQSRITSVSRNLITGLVESVELFGGVPVNTTTGIFASAALFKETAIFLMGQKTGMTIRLADGAGAIRNIEITAASNGDNTLISFVTPFADPPNRTLGPDCIVAVGPLGLVTKRMIVTAVAPQDDLGASISMVDEVSELFPLRAA